MYKLNYSRLGFFGLLLILSSSCTKLNNSVDEVTVYCGATSDLENHRLIKLLNDDQSELNRTQAQSLAALFTQPDGVVVPLTTTSNGCIFVPSGPGLIQVVDKLSENTSTHIVKESDPRQLKLELGKAPSLEANISCNGQAFYSNIELQLPWSFRINGDAKSLSVKISAVDTATQNSFVLFEKPFGYDDIEFTGLVQTKDLIEGSYQLQVEQFSQSAKISLSGSRVSTGEECELVVIHKNPELLSDSSFDSISTLKVNHHQKLDKTHQENIVHICQEPRSNTTPQSCEPSSICLSDSNFLPSDMLTSKIPGFFNYFYFQVDRAGNRSPTQCKTLLFSDVAPTQTNRIGSAPYLQQFRPCFREDK